MLVLTVETGEGLSSANSYITAVDADAYHEGHLYASDWTGATTATKEAALVMATRLIDGSYQFNGFKNSSTQALQWPRTRCPDPDRSRGNWADGVYFRSTRPEFDTDEIPQVLKDAVCEVARELIKADTTDAVDGEGLSRLSIAGSISLEFNKKDKQPTIPRTAQLFLMKLGSYLNGGNSSVRLTRV